MNLAAVDFSATASSVYDKPRIAVIIPIYGHPVLLSEALESVLAQRCRVPINIVIVSDGCRLPETDTVASAYATAHQSIVYLRKVNGGPSSARNYGIEFALNAWPTMEAVYFLDSDNRLTPTALDDAYKVLKSDGQCGWVYPTIDSFGIDWTANYGIPYSPLLHVVYDNMCDTGSLVCRPILEAGVRFDEDARSGYEDWDFWLQCLGHGFIGKHAPFGFSYRQRPESRYREMNRQRGAMIEHLRRRHWAIASPRNLLRWEHRTNPRYLFTSVSSTESRAFTDPADVSTTLSALEVVEHFYAARQHPDEAHIWPYFVCGTEEALETLSCLRMLHGIFLLAEREAGNAAFVAVTLKNKPAGEISLEIGPSPEPQTLYRRALFWMCRAQVIKEVVADPGVGWAQSISTSHPEPKIIEIRISAPDNGAFLPGTAATAALMDLIGRFRDHPLRDIPAQRWNWRPQHFPDRERYYELVCRYVGVSALMPRLAGSALEVGVVVPIAAFGGAEKVAYAMARYLRGCGARVHLFVLGAPIMKLLNEYDEAFDTINFLADPEFPVWGGDTRVMGQECFAPDCPEVKTPAVAGMLANLDLVVNCHSQPLNSVMGSLRAMHRVKTATYLHVFDSSPLRRPVGHPYLTVAFEHAYDLILTCSHQLAGQIHALGVPQDKILPIPNAAGFSIRDEVREQQIARRAEPRGMRKLRVLYIGRLDPQKGVERLVYAAELFARRALPVEMRVIGAGLMEDGRDWGTALKRHGVKIQKPIYASSDLAEAYAWADVLLLPSRWEGAPLVIAECHMLGCIPVATRVGAVEELTTHGVDGLLVDNNDDIATAEMMVEQVEALIGNDFMRRRMAEAGMHRAENNTWNENFAPLGEWVRAALGSRVHKI